jgi:hypothetical protein
MQDTTLTYMEFIFSAGEQRFYSEQGYEKPKRCRPCRDKRKRGRRGGEGFGEPG